MDDQFQKLIDAKDTTIQQLEEQNELLKQLAESRRLAHLHQCKELAEHRRFVEARKHPLGFFFFCFLRDVWPFKKFWKYDF